MFNKKYRAVSLLLSIILLISACPLTLLSGAVTSAETFSDEKEYFDFSQYAFNTVTLEELAAYNNYKGTSVNANTATKNVGIWSLESDNTVTGGKYLKYVKDNNGNNGGLYNYLFVANAKGNFATNDRNEHIVLDANTAYSIKIRYKVEDLEEEKYDLNLFAVATQGVATPNSCPADNLVYIKDGIGNTDGWVEATYRFTTPETYIGNCNSLLIGFNPAKEGTTTRPSEGTKFTYSVAVDCVEISRLATVRLNGVDSEGNQKVQTLYGVVGEKISFPDETVVIYENYDESTKEFSNPIDLNERYFKNYIYEDFYYKDETFDIESYNIDFSQYKLAVGSGSNGNVVKHSGNKWEIVSDSEATGGKYLKYEKYASTTGNNWKPYYHFMANPTGAYNTANKDKAVKLSKDTRYVMKIRYKIENLDSAYDLDLYANFTQGVWSPNSFHANNNINIATGLSNTDGWVEKEYIFKTPKEYVGSANSFMVGFYPTNAGTASFPTNDKFAYSVAIDYVKVDKATSIVLMSDGEVAETLYGTPGDTVTELPAVKKNGYKFIGWYKDADCSISAESVKLTNKNISSTLYAGWVKLTDSAVITDESYPDWRNNPDIYNGFTSDTANYFGGTSSFKYSGNTAYMLLNSEANPIIVGDESVYMMTLAYKLKKGSTANISFATSDSNKFNPSNAVVQVSKSLVGDDNWQKAIITFTANAKTYDALYLTVSSDDTVWIDDIVLSTSSSIRLEVNGGLKIDDLKGTPGEKAELPDPVWSGHSFSGWYKDSELSIPATKVKFPTDTESLTVYAAWDIAPPEALVDFENVPYENGSWKNPQYSYNKGTMTFINDDAFSGDGILRFNYVVGQSSTAYNQAAQSFAFYKEGQPVKIEDNTTYIITFWYRAKSMDADVRVTAQTCTAYNFYANAKNYTSGGYTIRKSSADGEWHKATIIFTSEPKVDSTGKLANALFLRINPLENKNATVDFDYVSLSKLGEDTAVISLVVDSTETQFVTTKKGGKITLPTPARENYIFRGWYSDSSFKNKLDATYTANNSATLYAKWSVIKVSTDFENYPKGWITNSDSTESNFRFGNSNMSISDSEYYEGSHSLRFNYDGIQSSKESMAQLYNLGDIFVAGDTPLILEENSVYMATIRYKVADAAGTSDVDFALAGRKNYYANRTRIKFFSVSSADISKGWQTATICFTATFKKENADALYLAFKANGSKADIYIDNFDIELLEGKSYVQFNANNNTLPSYSIGEAGSNIKYPETPKRKGYTFAGWYQDEGCKELFTSKTHGVTSIIVYAKWSFEDSIVISFEDEAQRSLNKSQFDTTEISNEQASHGQYSLKLNKAGNDRMNASTLLIYDNQPVTVEDGATYVLTYDYYVVQNSGKISGQTTTLPNVRFAKASNVWSGYAVPQNIWAINYEEECGKWFTASIIFTAELKEKTGNALYFTANYSENFVGYFDNLRLTRVKKGENESAVNLNPCGATDVGKSKLFYTGKAGNKIKLPTDLKKDGFTFIGWYEDTKFKKRIESDSYTILQSDTTIYAGWAKPKLHQDFENYKSLYLPNTYKYMDMDYELYDAGIAQSDKENVHSGNYSIHRIGNDFHTASFQILSETSEATKRLIPGLVYKMTMWVKLESKAQETGAIKIACSQSPHYAWAIDGEWLNVIAIKDLKVGEWTELTYTFYATDYYMSVQTPGNVSMYFDDVTFELLYGAKAEDCSKSAVIEEYIAVMKNENLSILDKEIDENYLKDLSNLDKSNTVLWLVIIIASAVVIILSGVVLLIILYKRKKVRKV